MGYLWQSLPFADDRLVGWDRIQDFSLFLSTPVSHQRPVAEMLPLVASLPLPELLLWHKRQNKLNRGMEERTPGQGLILSGTQWKENRRKALSLCFSLSNQYVTRSPLLQRVGSIPSGNSEQTERKDVQWKKKLYWERKKANSAWSWVVVQWRKERENKTRDGKWVTWEFSKDKEKQRRKGKRQGHSLDEQTPTFKRASL